MAGTASHVGKSTVVTGIVRALARSGVDVAPFKAQNMSNNARVGLVPDSTVAVYGEIGISQYVQARAAGLQPTTDHNPVLLKPRGGGESQLIVHGQPVDTQAVGTYYDQHWDDARKAAVEAFERLSATHDVIVAEGAGSIAEINLSHRDLANVETARFADADVLLLGDIERGGVFASLHGTMDLLEADLSDRVIGTVINKFRGDRSLLEPGIRKLEDLTGVPVLGVLPYADPGLPEEDSLSIPAVGERSLRGGDDGVSEGQSVTVGVPRWPRISNVTDVEPLAEEPGVRIAFLPLDDDFASLDAIVLPGTKNAVDDLIAARNAGFDRTVRTFDGPIIGLCGGYQLLGDRLENASAEGTVDVDTVSGFGVLPVTTTFSRDKRVRRRTVAIDGKGPIDGATGTVEGYEIHSGDTTVHGNLPEPLEAGSVNLDGVLGTYLHWLFENQSVRGAFVDRVFEAADTERPPTDYDESSPFEAAADLVTTHLDDSVLATYATD